MKTLVVFLVVLVCYILQLGAKDCSAEIKYKNGKTFMIKFKGWYDKLKPKQDKQ
jgi:hypothetical protein